MKPICFSSVSLGIRSLPASEHHLCVPSTMRAHMRPASAPASPTRAAAVGGPAHVRLIVNNALCVLPRAIISCPTSQPAPARPLYHATADMCETPRARYRQRPTFAFYASCSQSDTRSAYAPPFARAGRNQIPHPALPLTGRCLASVCNLSAQTARPHTLAGRLASSTTLGATRERTISTACAARLSHAKAAIVPTKTMFATSPRSTTGRKSSPRATAHPAVSDRYGPTRRKKDT